MKKIKLNYIGLILILLCTIVACEKTDIENINEPDREKALASDSDIISLIDGSVTDLFSHLIGFSSIYFEALADQTTTTNAYRGLWGFADQPRRSINNATTNADLSFSIGSSWGSLNSYIYNANLVLGLINNDNRLIKVGSTDLTTAKKTQALFVRGLSLGYLGMIYDKGYRVDENSDITTLEFEDYATLIGYALSDMDNAINTAPNDFQLPIYNGYSIDKASFVKLANTFRAKIAMGVKRGGKADENVDYNQIISWLEAGIDEDFNPPAKKDVLFNNGQDWMTYTLSDGSGYIPVDQKIPYLIEGDSSKQPADYPKDTSVILQQITNTSDSRIATYFGYSPKFGFLTESRGRHLFSNYRHARFYTDNDRNVDGHSTNILSKAEADYLKAEAQLLLGDKSAAIATINSSAKRAASGLEDVTNPKLGLLYEYSIELHLNGTLGTNFFFMRRHNLLQEGTPIHYPVPASELEISGLDLYTFGSLGGNDSAPGPGWKEL